jgi:hypothetical protein
MKSRKSMVFVLLLLLSAGVWAEGGKQRGEVGKGQIVQGQVRVVTPPAQGSASSTRQVAKAQDSRRLRTPSEDCLVEEDAEEVLF